VAIGAHHRGEIILAVTTPAATAVEAHQGQLNHSAASEFGQRLCTDSRTAPNGTVSSVTRCVIRCVASASTIKECELITTFPLRKPLKGNKLDGTLLLMILATSLSRFGIRLARCFLVPLLSNLMNGV
jgi:hypothetical protein